MKHKRFFNSAFAFPALALIIALAFSVCSNPTGSETKTEPLTEKYTAVKGAKTYELTITQSAANSQAKSTAKTVFTPAAGDSYVLKITENGVTQTSSGTVKAYSNNKFTLASSVNVSVSFEVTINSSGTITNITGTITVQGGVTITGPGALTPGGGDGGGDGDGDGDGDNNGSVTTFTSVAEFETWLNNQAANTESKPYSVVLVISDLNGLGTVLKNASDKYVSIDFTGSTFTSIGERAFYDCFRLTSITIPDKRKMTHFTQLQG